MSYGLTEVVGFQRKRLWATVLLRMVGGRDLGELSRWRVQISEQLEEQDASLQGACLRRARRRRPRPLHRVRLRLREPNRT